MLQMGLFFVVAGVPVFLFLRSKRRLLKIGPIYALVLTLPIVAVLWFAIQVAVGLGRL